MNRLSILIALLTLSTLAATNLVAQAPTAAPAATSPAPTSASPAPGSHLTLKDALDMAVRQNLDLSAARLQRAVSAAGIGIASERPNPSASFSASRDAPHEGIILGQPFEIAGQRGQRLEVARQTIGLTEMDITVLERQVRQQARDAYFDAAQALGVTAQKQRALQLTQQLQGIAQARFNAGDIPELEVLQASLEVARADAEWRVAQQEERVAFSKFNALVNEPPDTTWDLSGEFETLPAEESLNDLTSRAGAANPELLHLNQELKVEQSKQKLLHAERIPNLNLEFGLDLNSPGDYNVAPRGQVSMDLPLFSRNQGEIAESLAKQRLLEGNAAAKRRGVSGEVEAAYYEVVARRAEVQLYRETLLPAGRRLEGMAQDSYSAGKTPIMSALDAQRNVQQIESDYLDRLLALQKAFSALEEAVGAPLD